MRKIELLSPAGDGRALFAAVQNGADSVYLGLRSHNARMGAINFSEDEIVSAVKYAKLRNAKVYVTLNTLMHESELASMPSLINMLCDIGADALIVCDLGLVSVVTEHSKINLHASTQMSCNNALGARVLKKLGFSRIVLAREMGLEQIKHIKDKVDIETEIFAHGALCASFSGQCLYSFFHGGRSGNRGQCAQPCRLPYNGQYLLSTKDLMTIDILPSLIDLGVSSLKIEGRSKRPEYVAVVTSVYRQAIDLIYENEDMPLEKYREELIKIYNRGGFTKGYYFKANDIFGNEKSNHEGEYVGVVVECKNNKLHIKTDKVIHVYDGLSFGKSGMEISDLYKDQVRVKEASGSLSFSSVLSDIKAGDFVFRTTDKKQIDKAHESINKENIKHHLDLVCMINDKIQINAKNDKLSAEFTSDYKVQEAKTSETTKDDVVASLSKTGATVFIFDNISVIIYGKPFIPVKILNEARRSVIDVLEKKLLETKQCEYDKSFIYKKIDYPNIDIKVLITNNIETNSNAYDYKIYTPSVFDENITKLFLDKKVDGIALPRITFDEDIEFLKKIVFKNMIVICENIGQIEGLRDLCIVWAGTGLNAVNSKSVDMLYRLGCSIVFSSLECEQKLKNTIGIRKGFTPAMNFVICPKSAAFGCENCKKEKITDRKGMEVIFDCVKIVNRTSFILEKIQNKNGEIDLVINI